FFIFLSPPSATPGIYTLSLHDALPIWKEQPWSADCLSDTAKPFWFSPEGPVSDVYRPRVLPARSDSQDLMVLSSSSAAEFIFLRSEEHTSELQSRFDLVCRLLLEKKKK